MAVDILPKNKSELDHIDNTPWLTSYIIDRLKQHLANIRYTLRNSKGETVEGSTMSKHIECRI